jgi:hypothetical protein
MRNCHLPRLNPHSRLLSLCSASAVFAFFTGLLPTTAHADEQLFGWVLGSETLPAGHAEAYEFLTYRTGKAEGTYRALDTETEFEYGFTDQFQASLSLENVVTGSAIPGVANTYLTVEQAQKTIFPGASFTQFPVTLTPDQQKKIESRSKVGVRSRDLKVWKVSNGGWFLVDEGRRTEFLIRLSLRSCNGLDFCRGRAASVNLERHLLGTSNCFLENAFDFGGQRYAWILVVLPKVSRWTKP